MIAVIVVPAAPCCDFRDGHVPLERAGMVG